MIEVMDQLSLAVLESFVHVAASDTVSISPCCTLCVCFRGRTGGRGWGWRERGETEGLNVY